MRIGDPHLNRAPGLRTLTRPATTLRHCATTDAFATFWQARRGGRTLAGDADGASGDGRLEREALERLAAVDVDGCREALLRLGRRIAATARSPEGAAAALLLDVLHRLDRRLHPGDEDAPGYRQRHLALIRRFSECGDPQEAARRFRAEVTRMLGEVTAERPTLALRARRYIDEHYHRRISLSSIAADLNVSSSHLSRSFRRATSHTVTAYVHRVRIEHARVLLADGTHSISEIAYRVGYQTYRDFYRNFVRVEGAAPSDARRRLRERPTGTSSG